MLSEFDYLDKDDAYDAFIEGYAGNTPVYVCDYSE